MLASLPLLPSFRDLFTPLRPAFARQRTFENFVALAYGWVMALAGGMVSCSLVAGDLASYQHWTTFYRVFNRASWSIDDVCLAVALLCIDRFVPEGVIEVVADDTVQPRPGKGVFGAAMHHDALASTRAVARFIHGHCWVVLALVVHLPFGLRPRALPILFRLYRPAKQVSPAEFRKKTELALDLVRLLASALPHRQFRLLGDNLYSCETLLRSLPANVEMVGKLTLDAALYAPLPRKRARRKGRPAVWGRRLRSPQSVAESDRPWETTEARLYGRTVTVRYKTGIAYWKSAGPDRPLRWVVVWRPDGKYRYEAFFSTDIELTARQIVEAYACRWSIEVTFHETRASLGVDHPRQRSRKAVLRTVPTAMLLYSLVVLWYAVHGHGSPAAIWPRRPWYRHKQTASFADMIATLRRATLHPAFTEELGPDRVPRKLRTEFERWAQEAVA